MVILSTQQATLHTSASWLVRALSSRGFIPPAQWAARPEHHCWLGATTWELASTLEDLHQMIWEVASYSCVIVLYDFL